MSQIAKVGFIGLGAMGAPMAENLLKAGFAVTVHNRTRCKEEPLAALGARRAGSPAEAADGADCVITIVSMPADVKEVVSGPSGALKGAGQGALVIDMSTVGPAAAREVAADCAAAGCRFLDAPVSGGVWGAQQGTLSIMVGGTEEDFSAALPVFQAMGQTVIHFGPTGAGQAAKLANQIAVAGTVASVAEALVFAREMGLDLEKLIGAVSKGAGQSWALENLGPRMAARDFGGGFKVSLQEKDIRLVLQAADEAGMTPALTRLASQFFRAAEADGHGEDGTQSVITAFEKLTKGGSRQA